VTASGKCSAARVIIAGVSKWRVLAKNSKGTCSVVISQAGSANYSILRQTASLKVT
jgi:hypothetical protein